MQKSTFANSVWDLNASNIHHLLLAILLSGQVETNPGPDLDYPCGICKDEVYENDQALQCDTCNFWCHVNCCGMSEQNYKTLCNTTSTVAASLGFVSSAVALILVAL